MSDDPSSPYRPPPMARWKPPVLLARGRPRAHDPGARHRGRRAAGPAHWSTGGNPITQFFTARLQCHDRTVDPAVPEGIPTSVDLSDERLAGPQERLWWVGHNLAGAVGFVFGLLSPWLAWRWWFRTMGREAARDRAERGGGPDAGTRAVAAAAGRPPAG